MRKKALAAMAAALIGGSALLASAGSVAGVAEENEHNCAGAVSSGAASALGAAFGVFVSGLAQAQTVDDVGEANCGDNP